MKKYSLKEDFKNFFEDHPIICIGTMIYMLFAIYSIATVGECAKFGCHNNKVYGSSYCDSHRSSYYSSSSHTSPYGSSGRSSSSTTSSYSGKSSTSGSKNSYSGSSSSKSYTNSYSKTSNSSFGKATMPDCDDYDSYEEFMDDWDGCMPDGSDAEDYWENW